MLPSAAAKDGVCVMPCYERGDGNKMVQVQLEYSPVDESEVELENNTRQSVGSDLAK